ncbi:OLC1v1020576C1 [Oldenlandia corymbosa var. corymbosa]|uniref:OLC1v1020576C1 n=1 Tax=Oldenlandia corymbosa var. corymbosa TaxID=529605 RepID=A0AAV1EGP9_OLDCO|nr:OLC1v1020576C1 [Oldenlandia corymbosa var. corymbosa]
MSELLSINTLYLLHPIRRDEITRFVDLLAQSAGASKAVDVSSELVAVTYNIISRMTIGKRCGNDDGDDEARDIMKCVQEMSKIRGKFNACDYIWFLKKLDLQGYNKRIGDVRKRFDNRIEKIIEEHQEERMKWKQSKVVGEGETVKDLLDILLDLSGDKSSHTIKLTKDNIKAFLLNLFAAGVAASAVTIEWALAELINRPDIMKKATQEIDSVIGNDKRLVDESDLQNLPYLQAVVKETLRLYPAATLIKRQSSEDCEIGGYHIPAKTRLFVNVLAIGRDPDYWENPLQFCPERFLHDNQGNGVAAPVDVKGQHFQCLPFGSGRRGCPATSLALQIVQNCLAVMIQRFEWKVEGNNGKVDMEEGNDTTLHRANPLICFPVTRHS